MPTIKRYARTKHTSHCDAIKGNENFLIRKKLNFLYSNPRRIFFQFFLNERNRAVPLTALAEILIGADELVGTADVLFDADTVEVILIGVCVGTEEADVVADVEADVEL